MKWSLRPGPDRVYPLAALMAGLALAISLAAVPALRQADFWGQLPLAVVYMLIQSLLRKYLIDISIGNRRWSQTLGEVPAVVALFALDPLWMLLARLSGLALGEFFWNRTTPRHLQMFNMASVWLVTALTLLVTVPLAPQSALTLPRALIVPLTVWLVGELVPMITVPLRFRAEFGTGRRATAGEIVQRTFVPLTASCVGMLIAVLWEVSVWMLPLLGVLAYLLLRGARASVRVIGLSNALNESVAFSNACATAQDRASVLAALKCSTLGLDSVVTAHLVRWEGTVASWDTPPPAPLESALLAPGVLDELRLTGPADIGSKRWAVGVWRVLPEGTDLVVTTTRALSRQRDHWDAVGRMVNRAQLAIDNVDKAAELQRLAQADHRRARTDELTGLPNAFAARLHLEERLARPRAQTLHVLLCAVEGLKQINDVLGWAVGDEVIRLVAARLGELPAADYVARLSGNEFLLVVEGDLAVARSVAETLALPPSGTEGADPLGQQTAVVGIASMAPDEMMKVGDLLSHANLALEKALRHGAPVVFSDSDAADAARRLSIRMVLPLAVKEDRVKPLFQPQVDLRSGRLVGIEVLARWREASLGQVGPGEFIPIAEQCGHIDRLTESIVAQTLAARREWLTAGLVVPAISVNLCARSLSRSEFLARLVRLVDSEMAAHSLTFEITESTLASDLREALAYLNGLGARISIDDFGTGYSALAYLDQLPIHEVKIDRSMVMALEQQGKSQAVVTGILDICQGLGLSVVAEGVESDQVRRRLIDLGAEIGQGYHFGKAMSAEEIAVWMRSPERSAVACA